MLIDSIGALLFESAWFVLLSRNYGLALTRNGGSYVRDTGPFCVGHPVQFELCHCL